MKIVSASRRTDIPAFYAEWFMNRVREGYALVPNPFNPKSISTVVLRPEKVVAVSFCTKDPRPLLPHLAELERRGIRYWFQVTLTGLPRLFEPGVPEAGVVVEAMRELSRRVGPQRVVWRFDPILISRLTPPERIAENFDLLAAQLRGSVSRVMISFARPYRQLAGRLRVPEVAQAGVRLPDAGEIVPLYEGLIRTLSSRAAAKGIPIFACAERVDLAPFGIPRGSCIDPGIVLDAFGIRLPSKKDTGQRRECGCAESADLGIYGTCPHGCVYCYASCDTRLRSQRHDPRSPLLLGSPPPEEPSLLTGA